LRAITASKKFYKFDKQFHQIKTYSLQDLALNVKLSREYYLKNMPAIRRAWLSLLGNFGDETF
jgi:hypothetical protein